MTAYLQELARQVRASTITLLREAADEWLFWAPEGTTNHLIWHAGHAVWVVDLLCVQPLDSTTPDLPSDWGETFGMDCRPVVETVDWPTRNEVLSLLQLQLEHLIDRLSEARHLLSGPDGSDECWERTRRLIHGLHDEARHQGEMYLLIKQSRAGSWGA